MTNKATLILEDGKKFTGEVLSPGETSGEIVFNTSMTGYQEILTDPSYAGQIVTMTYPLIGNYGINQDDVESNGVHVRGLVVKEFCRRHSNHRATMSLIDYLNKNGIMAIEGLDTRALTRHLREKGAMKALITTANLDDLSLLEKLRQTPGIADTDWVATVTTKEKYVWPMPAGIKALYRIAAIDCGIKFNILRILASLGCEVHVFPAGSTADQLMVVKPNGIFISNGPGDPAIQDHIISTVKSLLGRIPIFGICLGHQILGLALGGRTYKLKFGHHGANHPVKDMTNGRIGMTSQNHNYCVDLDSLGKDDVEMISLNLNDMTVEGMRHRKLQIISYQHHPEASPGPRDANYLFESFIELMKNA